MPVKDIRREHVDRDVKARQLERTARMVNVKEGVRSVVKGKGERWSNVGVAVKVGVTNVSVVRTVRSRKVCRSGAASKMVTVVVEKCGHRWHKLWFGGGRCNRKVVGVAA